MTRYNDADALLQRLPDDLPYKASVKMVLMQAPEADVAPKSEVDFLRKTIAENAQKALEVTLEEIEKAKAEVAREIFEEIYEDCFDQFGYINYEALAELKKKYTEVQQ